MPEFRKWITALAGLALFAGLASAQVGPGNTTNSANEVCQTNTAVTPLLRAEGFTEVAGDIVITCTGGQTQAPSITTPIPTANIVVFVNTAVTSRLLSTTGNASEALLLIDEPGSTETGFGPSLPQTLCNNAQVGAGLGGCTEFVGSQTTGTGGTNNNTPTNGAGGPGANVFQGIVSGNQVTFFGIPVLAPGTTGNRVYRITNIRVNANGITAGGPTPGQVTASISISSSTALSISSSTLTVGFVQQGLSSTSTGVRTASNSGAASGTGVSFNQCTSASVTSTTSNTAAVGLLQYTENFGTAFKIRQQTALQNVPGTIYNSESNFVTGSPFTSPGTNTNYVPGQADYGTRLKATFSNVPAGVSIFVSTRDVSNSFLTPTGTPNAVLVVSETATDATSAVGIATSATPPGLPLASQTSTFSGTGTATGIAPVFLSAAATGGTSTGTAVWEVVNTNPAQIDTLLFSVFINFTASPATNSPAPGALTVTMSFAPTPSGGSFTATTGAAASNTLTIPRFSDSLDITKPVANIVLCTTALLYPYVVNVTGFDTGIAIANTTTDPFGTPAQTGTCALNFYGTGMPTTNPFITPTIATATVYANLASTMAPGFDGYMIANCNFQLAHGFAFVSDVGARNLAMGYLPLILIRSGTAPENLNN